MLVFFYYNCCVLLWTERHDRNGVIISCQSLKYMPPVNIHFGEIPVGKKNGPLLHSLAASTIYTLFSAKHLFWWNFVNTITFCKITLSVWVWFLPFSRPLIWFLRVSLSFSAWILASSKERIFRCISSLVLESFAISWRIWDTSSSLAYEKQRNKDNRIYQLPSLTTIRQMSCVG